jgi:Ca2+-binding EF-hand superfamily protein
MMLIASTCVAQLLGDPTAKPDAEPAPGRPAANVKPEVDNKRPADRVAGPLQANAMFAVLDANSDGEISNIELKKAYKALKTLDSDKNGKLTMAEASVTAAPIGPAGAAGLAGPLGEDPQVAQVMSMDRNKDGKLTANEVPVEMRPMLRGVDQNNDGITRQELAAAMANMRNQFGGGPGPWRGSPGGLNGARGDQQATAQFLQYDKDGNGKLTDAELPQQGKRLLREGDTNEDGALDAGELQAALAQQGGKVRPLRGGIDPDDPNARKNFRDRKITGNEN